MTAFDRLKTHRFLSPPDVTGQCQELPYIYETAWQWSVVGLNKIQMKEMWNC